MSRSRVRKILVVDDEVMIATTLALFLEDEGYDVILAHDGRRALELARAERPDMIITDYMMPRMGGLELARVLRTDQDLCTLPVLLTSALPPNEPHDLVAGILQKPFNLQALARTVRKLLDGSGTE